MDFVRERPCNLWRTLQLVIRAATIILAAVERLFPPACWRQDYSSFQLDMSSFTGRARMKIELSSFSNPFKASRGDTSSQLKNTLFLNPYRTSGCFGKIRRTVYSRPFDYRGKVLLPKESSQVLLRVRQTFRRHCHQILHLHISCMRSTKRILPGRFLSTHRLHAYLYIRSRSI